MSIRSRINKLEEQHNGTGTEVIVFQTLYADQDGNTDGENTSATAHIIWGCGKSLTIEREAGEAFVDYEARIEALSKLTWEQASSSIQAPGCQT